MLICGYVRVLLGMSIETLRFFSICSEKGFHRGGLHCTPWRRSPLHLISVSTWPVFDSVPPENNHNLTISQSINVSVSQSITKKYVPMSHNISQSRRKGPSTQHFLHLPRLTYKWEGALNCLSELVPQSSQKVSNYQGLSATLTCITFLLSVNLIMVFL